MRERQRGEEEIGRKGKRRKAKEIKGRQRRAEEGRGVQTRRGMHWKLRVRQKKEEEEKFFRTPDIC